MSEGERRQPAGLCLVNAVHITARCSSTTTKKGCIATSRNFSKTGAARLLASIAITILRGQRRRVHKAPALRARGGSGGDEGQARLRPVGADFLRRVSTAAARSGCWSRLFGKYCCTRSISPVSCRIEIAISSTDFVGGVEDVKPGRFHDGVGRVDFSRQFSKDA